ncbi:hypothetical protein SGLAM104S_02408 [Streptomyces glaucescens]
MKAGPRRDTAQGAEHATTESGAAERNDDRLSPDGPDETQGGVTADGPEPDEMFVGGPEVEVELRPQRRLRVWQLAPMAWAWVPIGSLMFAFPLAFDFGDSGAMIAMLGLLICSCAAGWGMMAARRVGYYLARASVARRRAAPGLAGRARVRGRGGRGRGAGRVARGAAALRRRSPA